MIFRYVHVCWIDPNKFKLKTCQSRRVWYCKPYWFIDVAPAFFMPRWRQFQQQTGWIQVKTPGPGLGPDLYPKIWLCSWKHWNFSCWLRAVLDVLFFPQYFDIFGLDWHHVGNWSELQTCRCWAALLPAAGLPSLTVTVQLGIFRSMWGSTTLAGLCSHRRWNSCVSG